MKAIRFIFILTILAYCPQAFCPPDIFFTPGRDYFGGLPIKIPRTIAPWLADSHYLITPDDEIHAPTVEELNRVLTSGGKRVRPLLTFLAAGLVGLHPQNVVQLAKIGEYTHTASLIHDDINDKDNIRRGKPTTRGIFGDNSAVLMGDYLLAQLTQEGITTLPTPELVVELMGIIKGMSVGERLQAALMESGDYTLEQYKAVIKAKTGVLFEWTLTSPTALLKENPECLRDRFSAFAIALGELYQMRDDTDPADYRKSEVNLVRWLAAETSRKAKVNAVNGPFTEDQLQKARTKATEDLQKLGKKIQDKLLAKLLRDSKPYVRTKPYVRYWQECAKTLRDVVDFLSVPSP